VSRARGGKLTAASISQEFELPVPETAIPCRAKLEGPSYEVCASGQVRNESPRAITRDPVQDYVHNRYPWGTALLQGLNVVDMDILVSASGQTRIFDMASDSSVIQNRGTFAWILQKRDKRVAECTGVVD